MNRNSTRCVNLNRSGINLIALIVCIIRYKESPLSCEAYSFNSKIKRGNKYNKKNNNSNPYRLNNNFVVMPSRFETDVEFSTDKIRITTDPSSLKKIKSELVNRHLKEAKEEKLDEFYFTDSSLTSSSSPLDIDENEYDFDEVDSIKQYNDFQNDLELSSVSSTYDPLNLSNEIISQKSYGGMEVRDSNNDLIDQNTEKTKDEKEILFARCLVLIAAALYGTNFTFVKLLGEHVPIGVSSALRFGMAAMVTLPWLVAPANVPDNDGEKESSPIPTSNVILAGMEVGMYNSLGYLAQAEGLQTTDASKSAFICSLAVVFVPILDAISGKSMSLQKALGAIIAVAGVALLELGDQSSLSLSHGDMLSLVQPMVFGIGFWRMEQAMHKYPSEAKRITAAQLFSVAIASILYCGAGLDGCAPPGLNEILSYMTNPETLASLFWTGIITTALTIYMETIALKTLTAAETTLIFSTEPLWAAFFGAFFVGERFGISAAFGAALIVSGCIYSNVEWKHHKKGNSINEINGHLNDELVKTESNLAP